MKAIMVLFDSLNRHMLPPYGGNYVVAPNFTRLAERTVTYDNSWIGSMPCIPARRELHTGRYNFLHRGWGPLEPFDDSMPEMLKSSGVYTHLVTDHQHYFEDGGATFHTRYSSWEFFRGQEGDAWKGHVGDPQIPDVLVAIDKPMWRQDWVNRTYLATEAEQPQTRTFDAGLDFMRVNAGQDRWFLQIETFDPHEPFFTQQHYKDLYPHDYDGPHFDWPAYAPATHGEDVLAHARAEYAALVSMCDRSLGRVLDAMDELGLWDDTMLIVCTDHGFLLGEHGWWAKNLQPFYNEIARTPLFVWDPRGRRRGERSDAFVQMIDMPATLLDLFGVARTPDMQGMPIRAGAGGSRGRGLFGAFGAHVCVTDGRYVYMRASTSTENGPLYEYTLMPTRIWRRFSVEELAGATLAEPFSFTKGLRTLRVPGFTYGDLQRFGTLLYDLAADPGQQSPIEDEAVELAMIARLLDLMRQTDAPPEQFARLGLPREGAPTRAHLAARGSAPARRDDPAPAARERVEAGDA
ncbi:MAG: sulfatase [Rhizobiales bacterium]|nr:sulfatase [Hyphomicrobiales bacterium]